MRQRYPCPLSAWHRSHRCIIWRTIIIISYIITTIIAVQDNNAEQNRHQPNPSLSPSHTIVPSIRSRCEIYTRRLSPSVHPWSISWITSRGIRGGWCGITDQSSAAVLFGEVSTWRRKRGGQRDDEWQRAQWLRLNAEYQPISFLPKIKYLQLQQDAEEKGRKWVKDRVLQKSQELYHIIKKIELLTIRPKPWVHHVS